MAKGRQNESCAQLKEIECFVFDMDGTINLGYTLIDGALDLINTLKEKNLIFVNKPIFYSYENEKSVSLFHHANSLLSLVTSTKE